MLSETPTFPTPRGLAERLSGAGPPLLQGAFAYLRAARPAGQLVDLAVSLLGSRAASRVRRLVLRDPAEALAVFAAAFERRYFPLDLGWLPIGRKGDTV